MKGKKRKRRRGTALLLAVLLACFTAAPAVLAQDTGKGQELPEGQAAKPVRQEADTSLRGWVTVPKGQAVQDRIPEDGILLAPGEETALGLEVARAGQYAVALTWFMEEEAMLEATLTVELLAPDGETIQSVSTPVYGLWRDASKEYATDRYGNEVMPAQEMLSVDITDYVRRAAGVDLSPVLFDVPAGEVKLRITSNDLALWIKEVRLEEPGAFSGLYLSDRGKSGASQGQRGLLGEPCKRGKAVLLFPDQP